MQLEIGSQMVTIGRELQRWLEVPENRVDWVVGDVMDADIPAADFYYLYRPVRPDGPGRAFYERLAATLDNTPTDLVIFSIADCLRPFLPESFQAIYNDGHLTCYRKSH